MDVNTLVYLIIGTFVMTIVSVILKKDYNMCWWKSLVLPWALTVAGVLSVKLMFLAENGNFVGLSFFGAVFLIPVFVWPISLIFKIKYSDYLDITAPSVAAMLSVMKINCLVTGCCAGKVLANAGTSAEIRFPSQVAEMIVAVIIAVILIILIKQGLLIHSIFPFFMILYGSTRFVLNLFRETTELFFGMGIGNMWSVLSVFIGVIWMLLRWKNREKPDEKTE